MQALNRLAMKVHEINKENGFYDSEEDWNPIIKLCLVHTEVSEAVESIRKGYSEAPSKKDASITNLEEEVADTLIRLLDLSEMQGLNLDRAVEAKLEYNQNRPYRHGGRSA